ncbi:MAG: hypothetical protein K0R15_2408 [Clostridiales bacterium]|jgi:hypothetical protein|nr:hypothetical protein [Clostridiales bacterium]
MANSREYRLNLIFAVLFFIIMPLLMGKTTGIHRTIFAFLYLISATVKGTIMIKNIYKKRIKNK